MPSAPRRLKDAAHLAGQVGHAALVVVIEAVTGKTVGTAQQLDSVQANNIRVVADLSGLGTTTGVFEPPARVYIDGVTGVGAIGNYTFYVRLT